MLSQKIGKTKVTGGNFRYHECYEEERVLHSRFQPFYTIFSQKPAEIGAKFVNLKMYQRKFSRRSTMGKELEGLVFDAGKKVNSEHSSFGKKYQIMIPSHLVRSSLQRYLT